MASDGDSDEDFVNYGTPLEPLEEDEPLRRPVPLHEQTVKDEKGRFQRFHGAFTGGFSAGYFNTVGSKEGWTPSTFVSSRQQKAGQQQARPEDFMDQEDFGEHGMAPTEISTSAEYQSSRRDKIQDKAKTIHALSAPIPGDTLLEELIAPARLSIGVELLKKMGWKEGQGVGPRVKRKASRQKTKKDSVVKVYGCAAPRAGSEESEDEDEDEFAPQNVTFAPKDVSPIDFNPKVGVHGLGYHGLDPGRAMRGGAAAGHINLFSMDSDRASSLIGGKKPHQKHRGGVAGQAFGVGALEDEDEEVYHRDAMSNYDMVLGGEEPGDGLYGWTAPQQYKKKKEKNSDVSYLGKILEGFTLASKTGEVKTVFTPPSLPRDYRPVHHFRPVVDLTKVSPIVAAALQASRGQMVPEPTGPSGRHNMDSGQRAALLGEEALQGPTSVMDMLRPEDRERLAKLRSSSQPASGPAPTKDPHGSMVSAGGAAARALAQQALASRFQLGPSPGGLGPSPAALGPSPCGPGSFKPFEKNPSKQARYELYVSRMRQGDRGALDDSIDGSMTEWERSREREEFSRSALLYRPSGSFLSSRFTSAKHADDLDSVEVPRDQEGDEDDKQAAVKMKMFGKLTRDSLEWHPDPLLCKRFNLPDPYPGSGIVGLPTVKRDRFSVFNFLTVAEPTAAAPATPALPEPTKRSRWDSTNKKEKTEEDPLGDFLSTARSQASAAQGGPSSTEPSGTDPAPATDPPAEPDTKTKDAPGSDEEEEDEERPSMDLFKAVFASSSDEKSSSSSSEEEEDDDEEDKDEGERLAGAGSLFNITPSVKSTTPSTAAVPSALAVTVKPDPDAAPPPPQEEEEFGPKLPPPSAALSAAAAAGESSRCLPPKQEKPTRSKEKHKAKKQHKHKKDKKKKKQKKHKHKGKEKEKKKKSRKSDSSSEGEEDEPGQVSTEELLQRLKNIRSKEVW
ncbi:G patch domain-containing protein 1 isoform X1 [Gadus morhua]|uniref:G patch domain-containing protein 1 isoform X1 n=1 Tax=Gadus morhua TaxID=8049 RepID=UPI0011B4D420|nr:G patch domain-containing protein 1 isoform X1 [Gadus morhua]